MPADNVVVLAERRAVRSTVVQERELERLTSSLEREERHGIAVALQASQGAVTMIVGTSDDGAEVWLSPEEAESLGDDLRRCARAARGLAP